MKTVCWYLYVKKDEIKRLEMGALHLERRAIQMIGTNARTTNGMSVVGGTGLREWLVGHLGASAARVRADAPDDIAWAAQTRHEVNDREPRRRDPGATPARWTRLI